MINIIYSVDIFFFLYTIWLIIITLSLFILFDYINKNRQCDCVVLIRRFVYRRGGASFCLSSWC